METIKAVFQVAGLLLGAFFMWKAFKESEDDNDVKAIYFLLLAMLMLK